MGVLDGECPRRRTRDGRRGWNGGCRRHVGAPVPRPPTANGRVWGFRRGRRRLDHLRARCSRRYGLYALMGRSVALRRPIGSSTREASPPVRSPTNSATPAALWTIPGRRQARSVGNSRPGTPVARRRYGAIALALLRHPRIQEARAATNNANPAISVDRHVASAASCRSPFELEERSTTGSAEPSGTWWHPRAVVLATRIRERGNPGTSDIPPGVGRRSPIRVRAERGQGGGRRHRRHRHAPAPAVVTSAWRRAARPRPGTRRGAAGRG